MPRVTTVQHARKEHTCMRCRRTIAKGESYRWFARKTGPASGYTVKRCADCPPFKPSELTANQYQATYLAAVEAFDDDPKDTVDWIVAAMREVADAARENSERLRESASNIEDGFGHPTFQSEELEERAEGWEQFADDVESEADEVESTEFDPDEWDDEDAMLEDLRERASDAVYEQPE